MELRDKIKSLLESDISAYRIAQDTGVPQSTITYLRNGTRKVDRLTLKSAEQLANYFDKAQKDSK
ncbi:XRE family transcriptional regulator [Lentilactobacillus buchneri]|uniref:helix-turn-helix transcriptional regulator n=1 Tax=Lentilactobacillus buchneri TaxID=1581 RepID=UPI0021A3453D|nr:helix-turn-helix transcriptional regulator [Lentilactobacillus buchneri]MCT2899012.1 XRE family transcriptional regulator [Lentilactobacillus buchneri]